MMIAVAAPAVPAVSFGLLTLLSAIAFVVSWGLLHGWNRTVGSLLLWLADKKISLPSRLPDIQPFGFARDINNTVIKYLGQAVGATEHAMVYSFQRMVAMIQWTGQELAGLATDAYNAIRGIGHTAVKPAIDALDAKQNVLINKLKGSVAGLTHTTVPNLQHALAALKHQVARLSHAAGHAIASPFPRIGRIEKDLKGVKSRLKKAEKALAVGAGAALTLTALKRLGLGWLRCNNVGKAGKAVCGMNPSLLEQLLLDAALLTVAFNLETFAKEMQSVTEEAASLIHKFAD